MKQDKRMEKIEGRLTPKQAALVWLKETNSHDNIMDYVRSLRGTPLEMMPVPRITGQVQDAIKDTMKGQLEQAIRSAVHRAQLDVCFLIKLHNHINYHYMTEERVWDLLFAVLQGRFQALDSELSHQRMMRHIAGLFSLEMPYPVDQETGDALNAAIQNYVTTWDTLKDDTFDEWVFNYFVDRGAKNLPEGAYAFVDGKWQPDVNDKNEKELRESFKDKGEFERFKAGEDYTKGFSDVKDAEYNAHYERMVSALHGMVDSGKIKKGKAVYIETVPVPFLQWAPLVEGVWLDWYVVELAELGALLRVKGYQTQETNDIHPLAWPRFVDDKGEEIDKDELIRIRKLVEKGLKKFNGQTKEIDGRPYINFDDYCSWPGRKLKGNLYPELCEGFVTSSWNAWLDAGGKEVEGVKVGRLECYLKEHEYRVSEDGSEELFQRRESIMNVMDKASSPSTDREEAFLKENAGLLLAKLYTFREANATLSRRYFDGEELLFPDLVRDFSDLISYTEELVALFNDEFTGKPERMIDVEALRKVNDAALKLLISNLVCLARSDALEAMGEDKAATEMVERLMD